MAAPRRTREQDIESLFRNLDLHARVQALEQNHAARIQNLEQQVLALQGRVHALEVENEALKADRRGSTIPESVNWDAPDEDHEMRDGTSGDLPEHHSPESHTLVRECRAESVVLTGELADDSEWDLEESPEHIPSPPTHQITSAPTISTPSADYTVWYENGALHTNAPPHLLATPSWTSLLAAFTNTRTYISSLNPNWASLTHPTNCIRGILQRGSSVWTVDSPGKYCCKRCFNTQRVCLKYDAVNVRLEVLPLPEEVRDEGEEFGVGWFVAEEGNMSNKGVFKGLWK